MDEEKRNEIRQVIREDIHGVGDQFIDDIWAIYEKYRNDSYVFGRLDEDIVSETLSIQYFLFVIRFLSNVYE